ncbi:queuine tRNA-ribosyltransferase [Candidatus Gottesmanbacteria bacterium]|nr:queuine tRNA-ribosyltransferase [Candidatus Gottesmanbacteria bacterium]
MFRFKILHRDTKTKARVGEIHTPHGVIKTPAFVPVGTQASVKSLTPEEIKETGTDIFFVNTYHMYLRPGIAVVEKFGGLHQFMGWNGPIITDSGGFQVFSLSRGRGAEVVDENFDPSSISVRRLHGPDPKKKVNPDKILSTSRATESLVRITEEGVEFRSHWDGSKHLFTPEKAMEWQWKLGSDIHIAFDDCTPYGLSHEKAKKSLQRTHAWAKRSLDEHRKLSLRDPAKRGEAISRKGIAASKTPRNDEGWPYQALYGSVQGSVYEDLRKESATFISSLDFDGMAIGGVSVGETKKEMVNVLDWVVPYLPQEKPRHLLGVGEIDDIFALVERGMDTFDCVQPTRLARVGRVLIWNNPIIQLSNNPINKWEMDITKKEYAEDVGPLDISCKCYTCTHFSRAYVHHLFHVRELLGYRLASIHNLWFMHRLMYLIRDAIGNGTLLDLKKKWI